MKFFSTKHSVRPPVLYIIENENASKKVTSPVVLHCGAMHRTWRKYVNVSTIQGFRVEERQSCNPLIVPLLDVILRVPSRSSFDASSVIIPAGSVKIQHVSYWSQSLLVSAARTYVLSFTSHMAIRHSIPEPTSRCFQLLGRVKLVGCGPIVWFGAAFPIDRSLMMALLDAGSSFWRLTRLLELLAVGPRLKLLIWLSRPRCIVTVDGIWVNIFWHLPIPVVKILMPKETLCCKQFSRPPHFNNSKKVLPCVNQPKTPQLAHRCY